jgi:hypothetical protein
MDDVEIAAGRADTVVAQQGLDGGQVNASYLLWSTNVHPKGGVYEQQV